MNNNDLASVFFTDQDGNHCSVFKVDLSFTNVKRFKDTNIWGFFVYVPTLAFDGFDGFFSLSEGSEELCVKFQKWFCERIYQDGSFSVNEFGEDSAQRELFKSNDMTNFSGKDGGIVIELDAITSKA